MNVNGGNVTIMFGRDGDIQVHQEQTVVQGDWNALDQSLTQYGFPAEDIQALKEALRSDGDQVGESTKGWLGQVAMKVADGALTVAIPVVVRLIRGYLGLG